MPPARFLCHRFQNFFNEVQFFFFDGGTLFFFFCLWQKSDDGFFEDAPANPDKVKLVELVNQFRASGENCGGTNLAAAVPVSWNDTLALVAKKHSVDMNNNNELNHEGTDGSMVDDRIAAEGYVYSFYAENLLKGTNTEEAAIEAWKNSPAHCKNLMEPKINEIGIGTAGPYWTMVLASH